jgi:hypothetical protein
MWVYRLWIDKEASNMWSGDTGSVFVVAKRATAAVKVLESRGFAACKDGDGRAMVDMAHPDNVKATDTVFVAEDCKNETVMYKDLAQAANLEYLLK